MSGAALRERLARVLEAHFDPRWGSRFWLERARALGFDPRREIASVAELPRLGPPPGEELALRPVEEFVPRRFHDRLHEFVSCETGGTTGPPRRTLFREDEFEAAFVTPFVRAAELSNFPRGLHWLFVGPSGPHAIGKAARACARAWGSVDPFGVDFDPRWARRLAPDSLARRRYLEHVLAQAEALLTSQEIGVLFATPPVLEALAGRLEPRRREVIAGIHLGGMAAEPDFFERLGKAFPSAVVMAGYGNSLAGMCPQLAPAHDGRPAYFPHGARLVLEVAAEPGGRGPVRFHRLDESALLPNVIERDLAESVACPALARSAGFGLAGLYDPRPPAEAATTLAGGLY